MIEIPEQACARAAADMLRALAHPMRLSILCRLASGEAPVSAFENELGLKQPSLSQQLAHLREAGLVTTRRASKAIFYRLDDTRVLPILHVLQAHFGPGCAPGAAASAPVSSPQPAPSTRPAAPASIRPPAPRVAPNDTACAVFAQAGWPRH